MPQVRANGIDIEYESFGRDGDPAIVMIMGFAAQLTVWPRSLCTGLADKGFRVIRFDNRDIGKSTHLSHLGAVNAQELMAARLSGKPMNVPYHLSDMAADAAGLLEALRIGSAHIVGASMGGMIAQLFAANHPRHTRSQVSIMSTTGRMDLPQAKPEAMVALMQPPASPGREDRIKAATYAWRVIGSPLYPMSDDEMRNFAEEQVDRTPYDPEGISRHLAAVVAAPARNDALKSVKAPSLVIHGADDPLIPVEGGKDTAASIAGCELVIVPGMGHDFSNALVPLLLKHIGDFVIRAEAHAKVA